jgi:hypothetical protein
MPPPLDGGSDCRGPATSQEVVTDPTKRVPTACRKGLVAERRKEVVTGRRKDFLPHQFKIIVPPTQASDKLRIADEVAYEGLTPGQEYVMTGTLMDKATGKAIDGATASATFTPKEESGTVTVTFEVDGSKLAGHDLVAFEVLTRGEATVATHEDIEDEGQTVRVVTIGTTATDKADGDHAVEAAKVEIVDVVAYQGLTPG